MSLYRVGCRWGKKQEATGDKEILDVFFKLGMIFVGDVSCKESFKNTVKQGDLLLINSGLTVKAVAIIKSEVFSLSDFDTSKIDEFDLISETNAEFDFYDAKNYSNGCYAIIYKLKNEDFLNLNRGFTFSKCNEYSEEYIKKIISRYDGQEKMNEKISEIVALLRKKKNIILQGAPGTGKTYTTAEIALSILGKDITQYETHEDLMKDYENLLIKIDDSGIITSGQIGFVTFHQSMDYEDFVEGIKPKTEGDGNVTYDVEDGIFKVISNKAKYRKYRSFSDAYTNFINDIRDKYSDKNPLKIKTRTDSYFAVTVNSNNNLTLYTGENFSKQGSLTKENILKQINGEEKYKGWDSYFCGVIDYLSSKYGYKDEQESQMPYVLIIDEINRGNVSKIFGELITLLEADKRTEGNHPLSVTLPYSKEKFEIPSNLYIIGTMNTTDRSVGNIDYAVRRRFSFVTLESERSVVLAKNNGDEKSLAVQLFDSVMKFLTKNRNDMDIDDLMVGHSYFLADDENELKIKWKYDILPLLREYCKDGITKKDVDKNCSIQDFINSQNEQN